MRPGATKGTFGATPNQYSEETIVSRCSVEPNTGCWLWTENLNMWGYGKVCIQKKHWIAHRASFKIFNKKDIPRGMFVLHKCDVRSCVNPEHLFLGTHKENMKDMVKKGRAATGDRNTSRKNPHLQARGSKHYFAKLNEKDVFKIKLLLAKKTLTQKQIGAMFNTTSRNINNINVGLTWRHVVIKNNVDQSAR